ncbi:hypothetical protein GB937_008394 [Aspergillus fischeri]|nr:hypothetical protein GB937_008394 [Aspergillus fischeri]
MKITAVIALALAAVVAASPVAEPELVERKHANLSHCLVDFYIGSIKLTVPLQVPVRATVPLWRRAPAPSLALRALVAIPPATAPSTLLVFVTIARERNSKIWKELNVGS